MSRERETAFIPSFNKCGGLATGQAVLCGPRMQDFHSDRDACFVSQGHRK